ncbi:methyltransferase domain-containing protein [Nakamurella sp. YIM 132087]|uniref:Methyltransferase domain-containing protein n=1 Tax=Nakamurella alba TaxID=2665158 RepID=A0A7K1FNC6_9ACTN|nr:class I SAM-dependent methyltransferase [Nakamurella alba]MTD14733.1 methyltransferase domain-containing protein [Nakamurella alba]
MIDQQRFWDEQAETFDQEPDHGLLDPAVRAAWAALLREVLPEPPARILDLGCGTGSLALLCAEAGHRVDGIDSSPRMIDRARAKARAAGLAISYETGDAADPPASAGPVNVILARHLLWALPDPSAAISRWVELLAPGGSLVVIEGLWSTGAGIPAEACRRIVLEHRRSAVVTVLDDPVLWGRVIDDERYLLVSPD